MRRHAKKIRLWVFISCFLFIPVTTSAFLGPASLGILKFFSEYAAGKALDSIISPGNISSALDEIDSIDLDKLTAADKKFLFGIKDQFERLRDAHIEDIKNVQEADRKIRKIFQDNRKAESDRKNLRLLLRKGYWMNGVNVYGGPSVISSDPLNNDATDTINGVLGGVEWRIDRFIGEVDYMKSKEERNTNGGSYSVKSLTISTSYVFTQQSVFIPSVGVGMSRKVVATKKSGFQDEVSDQIYFAQVKLNIDINPAFGFYVRGRYDFEQVEHQVSAGIVVLLLLGK